MKRQHLWGIVEGDELTPDTFTSQREAREDIRMHKEIGVYAPNAKVVKLIVEKKKRKRK